MAKTSTLPEGINAAWTRPHGVAGYLELLTELVPGILQVIGLVHGACGGTDVHATTNPDGSHALTCRTCAAAQAKPIQTTDLPS